MATLALIAFVVLGSAIGMLVERMGVPSLSLAMLSPALVMEGHIWRLLTWGFFETDGQNLVIGVLMLGIFGRDLAGLWSGVRYLVVCALLVFATGLSTSLVMLMLPMAGRNLLYMTVGMTVLFAIMHGFANFVPHLLAMALMYAYIRGGTMLAAQLKLNRLLSPKRANPGFKVFEGGSGKGNGKGAGGSGWVH
jgi:hypothetical protein